MLHHLFSNDFETRFMDSSGSTYVHNVFACISLTFYRFLIYSQKASHYEQVRYILILYWHSISFLTDNCKRGLLTDCDGGICIHIGMYFGML